MDGIEFSMNDIKEFFNEQRRKRRAIEKTVPAKPEWTSKHREMMDLADKLVTDTRKLEALKNKFWADLQLELNTFADMTFNDKTGEVEIYAKEGDKGLIKSPYLGS